MDLWQPVLLRRNDARRRLMLARLPMLLMTLTLDWCVFCSTRRLGGDWAILRQQFLERLPIVLFPTGSQALRQALGKARMVKNELGA